MLKAASHLGSRYWRLWVASTSANLADGINLAALPLLTVTLTSDPRIIGGMTAAQSLPWLVFSLFAGAFVDRYDRQRLLTLVGFLRAVVISVLVTLVLFGWITLPLLFTLIFLVGIGETLFDNATQTYVPDLVTTEQLAEANGHRYAGEVVGNGFLGPALGGLLFGIAAFTPLAVGAAALLVAAALVTTVRPASTAAAPGRTGTSIWHEIGKGLRWLSRHTMLRWLALVLGIANLAYYLSWGIVVLLAKEELHLNEIGFGLLLAAMAIGGVLGGTLGAPMTQKAGPARCITVSLLGLALCEAALVMLNQPVAVGACLAVIGLITSIWNIATISLRQTVVPRELLGRVSSAYRLIGLGSNPIGAFLGGFIANAVGIRMPFAVAAVVLLIALLLALVKVNPRIEKSIRETPAQEVSA